MLSSENRGFKSFATTGAYTGKMSPWVCCVVCVHWHSSVEHNQ